jgi:hypothetical protein
VRIVLLTFPCCFSLVLDDAPPLLGSGRLGGPEVMDVVELPDPAPGDGEQLYEVSSAGLNYADTHHRLS